MNDERDADEKNPKPPVPVPFPVSNTQGGTLSGIDLNNNSQLLDIMDGIE